ncbi:MAG TPA: hypothetical protein VF201_07940 [Nitrolancea sp.]
MTRQTDELDRLIDHLNAGARTPLNEPDDPELAGLIDAVQRVRQLRDAASPDAGWPGRAVAQLARDLRSGEPPAAESREPTRQLVAVPPASSAGTPRPSTKRRTISSELAQMAAAIVVLVLVGGVLALVFHEQSGGNQGGVGAGATATSTSGSQLPQSVTASGLRITLVGAKLNGNQIVLTFKIESADPNQPSMWAIGGGAELTGILPGENDIDATGLRWDAQNQSASMISPLLPPGFQPQPPAPSPAPKPTPAIVGYQESLPFVLTGSTDQAVTVTIRRVRFEAAPSTRPPGRIISGAWSFKLVPALLGAPPLPTPNRAGSYDRLSVAQAEQLVGFPIATPNPLPDVLKPFSDDTITASAIGSTGTARANYVFIPYPAVNMAEKGVSVVETSAESAVPTVQDNAIHWIDTTGHQTTAPVSQLTQTSLTIAGQTVTRWDTVQQGANVVYFLWDNNGVHFVVYTIPKIQVTEAVMEQFVRAMIAPSATTTQVQPSPTPPFALPTPDAGGQIVLTLDQARQIAPFFVTKPQWVPDYLTDQGIIVPEWQGAESAGSLVQEIMLTYLNAKQQISVQITEEGEHVPRAFASASTPTTMTIGGQSVTRTDIVAASGTPIRDYLWQEQGTTFELTGTVTDPLTEQDLEHMIASMIEQGESNKPATATSALPQPTPTTSNLPLTVSANGVPVTLESITTADSGTSFEFQVRLPDTMAATTFPTPVLILPNDARLVHGTDTAKPQLTLRPHEPGNPDVHFSFAFAPIGKPNDAITLTINRIRVTVVLPGSPSSSQQVLQGPWVFHINPETFTESATPDTSG